MLGVFRSGLWTSGTRVREAEGQSPSRVPERSRAPAAGAGRGHRRARSPERPQTRAALRSARSSEGRPPPPLKPGAREPGLPRSESEAGSVHCAGVGRAGGWGGRGRSGGVGREALPGCRREGRIGLGSAPPGGAACAPRSARPRPLLPPLAEPGGAGSRGAGAARGPRAGQRARQQPRAPHRRPSVRLSNPSGLCHRAGGERGSRASPTARKTSPRVHGRAEGAEGPCLTRARRASRTSR